MNTKDVVKIHLPDGNIHKLVGEYENITEEGVSEIRKLFGRAENIEIQVQPDPLKDGDIKTKHLVLWGETLKKSYLTIERY